MKTSAYEKKLFNQHKKFIKSIKTTNDVWDKLLDETLTIHCSSLFYEISHLFSKTKQNDEQVEITLCHTNKFNGIETKAKAWIDSRK